MDIAIYNGFSKYEIFKLNKQIKSKLFSQSITSLYNSPSDDIWFSLTYFGTISDSIKRIFHKYHIIYFSNCISHKPKLQNNKILHDTMICSGVYNLTCNCFVCSNQSTFDLHSNWKLRPSKHCTQFVNNLFLLLVE